MKKSTFITLFVMVINLFTVCAQESKNATSAAAATSFSAGQFKDKFKTSYVLLDVRTAQEFKSGHINGAKSMEVMDKNSVEKIKDLKKESNIFIYGKSSEESKLAAHILMAAGYQNLYTLEGTFADLISAGMPLAK